ncbi:hypothetical protein [Taibaiella koreensis]|uniref:hypothetical protein n=1 Tax=Taibaiella koreensis TaxID=1268548 RepID=UPI0013C2AA71|nr:hypothetical protein [Taibaiella koreensis]
MLARTFLFAVVLLFAAPAAMYAQQFKQRQQALSVAIKQAYQKKKITETEYQKLSREQEEIGYAIERAEGDSYLTAKEKNTIHAKLNRAEKRLRKYKTNREVY